MAEKSDVLIFAYKSVFLGLFLSCLVTILSAGSLLLDADKGFETYENIADRISTRSSLATASGLLDNIINSEENKLAFDIVLGLINIGLYIFKIIEFLTLTLVNFFLLSVWLADMGVPGAITGMIVFAWQFWALWHIAKFIFKGERVGG